MAACNSTAFCVLTVLIGLVTTPTQVVCFLVLTDIFLPLGACHAGLSRNVLVDGVSGGHTCALSRQLSFSCLTYDAFFYLLRSTSLGPPISHLGAPSVFAVCRISTVKFHISCAWRLYRPTLSESVSQYGDERIVDLCTYSTRHSNRGRFRLDLPVLYTLPVLTAACLITNVDVGLTDIQWRTSPLLLLIVDV